MIYYPPNPIDSRKTKNLVFLAGPIQGAPNWHQVAIEYIQANYPDIDIACPKRPGGIVKDNFNYEEQVSWETDAIYMASLTKGVIFWLPCEFEKIEGRSYAQTTRFELAELFGEWRATQETYQPFAVGIEEGFPGERYIRYRLNEAGVKVHRTLSETIEWFLG